MHHIKLCENKAYRDSTGEEIYQVYRHGILIPKCSFLCMPDKARKMQWGWFSEETSTDLIDIITTKYKKNSVIIRPMSYEFYDMVTFELGF